VRAPAPVPAARGRRRPRLPPPLTNGGEPAPPLR